MRAPLYIFAIANALPYHLDTGVSSIADFQHDAMLDQVVLNTAFAPSVSLSNGTVIGRTNGFTDDFVGIPFAQPPIGPLRLRPPQPLKASFGTLRLPLVATACPQQPLSPVNTSNLPPEVVRVIESAEPPFQGPQGEDCLTLTVQRPTGTGRHARLPVLLWIYGGGFQVGATSQFNASRIMLEGVASGKPFVFVTMNYRGSAFGFLASRELQKDGCTNLGLRDQRLAMEWVAENIEAFGGDPERVTIWGESAGAVSVFDQLLVNNGNHWYRNKPLFTGAIMNSGAIVPTLPVDSPNAERVYGNVVQAAGCSRAKNTLQCLRSVSYETFFNASNVPPDYLGYNSLALPYLPRPDHRDQFFPSPLDEAIKRGKFARVPIISGNQQDEGTRFAIQQRNLSTSQELVEYFSPQYPLGSLKSVASLIATYPDNPVAGSPFGTGYSNELYPQYKRIAAIEGDISFTLRRRQALASIAPRVPSWSYLATYRAGFPFLGTYHASDISEIFDGMPNARLGNEILQYYLNFLYYGTPNGVGLKLWPQWEERHRVLLNISMEGLGYSKDYFREESYKVLIKDTSLFAL